jgi:hypothetical protein
MARDAALVTSWNGTIPGREGKALEGFTDFLTYFGKLAADGKVQEAEPFFSTDGSTGFAIVRGKSDGLQEATETEEFEKLLTKAQLTVKDLRSQVYYTGDEEVQRAIRLYAESANELGYL